MKPDFSVGDIAFYFTDLTDPKSYYEFKIAKAIYIREPLLYGEKNGEIFYMALCWPIRLKQDVLEIVKKRQELKKILDDSMNLVYALRNAMVRGEK